ncbi:MAG: hypothetical protein ABIS36_23705 [Chryseolinea sp.]
MLKIISLLLLSTTVAYPQALPANSAGAGTGLNLPDQMLILESKKSIKSGDVEPIDGTPYLSDEFQPGNVVTTKGVFTAIPMRYNIGEDYIEFKQKDITYILDPSSKVKKVSISDKNFMVDDYTVKGKTRKGFYILLDSGKITVLVKKKVLLHPAQPPKALESDGHHAKYEKLSDDFAYKLNGGPITDISSVKKMIEVLPDHQEELKKFVSKERISKNQTDLAKLAHYYNQLQ